MMEHYKMVYSVDALQDLEEIYLYISTQLLVPEIAVNQVNRIRKAIRALDSMPMRFALVEWEPWHSMEVHKLPVDHYVVFYVVNANTTTVSIVRIFYDGRNIQEIVQPTREK